MAKKMMAIRNDEAALNYLSHRVRMEQDFYEEPTTSTFPQLRDTFEVRQHKWGYDLAQKQYLEWICPLLDSLRVNEWRQEVGLPLIEAK